MEERWAEKKEGEENGERQTQRHMCIPYTHRGLCHWRPLESLGSMEAGVSLGIDLDLDSLI